MERVPATLDRRRGPRWPEVVIVDRPGSVQSELRIGHVGIARDHVDYPAIVMASLLGGTFSSRLNQRLREDLGYTYGARAAFDPRRSAARSSLAPRSIPRSPPTPCARPRPPRRHAGRSTGRRRAARGHRLPGRRLSAPLRDDGRGGCRDRAGRGLRPRSRMVGDLPKPDRGGRSGRGPSRGDHAPPAGRSAGRRWGRRRRSTLLEAADLGPVEVMRPADDVAQPGSLARSRCGAASPGPARGARARARRGEGWPRTRPGSRASGWSPRATSASRVDARSSSPASVRSWTREYQPSPSLTGSARSRPSRSSAISSRPARRWAR